MKVIIENRKHEIIIFASSDNRYVGGVAFSRFGIQCFPPDHETILKSRPIIESLLELLNFIYGCIGRITILH